MNTIEIDNLKCGGCANTITTSLGKLDHISNVSVDVEASTVSFESENDEVFELVKSKLSTLGYPEKGTGTGFQKAKSYVSCAIGKVS